MQLLHSSNSKTPLLSWDIFCSKYNSLLDDAIKYRQAVFEIKQIAGINKWSKPQVRETVENIQRYVIIITDHLQQITFAGRGFYEMTGYTSDEAKGRNPKFLQGPATNIDNTRIIKKQLGRNETFETILENYRRNGELYLCKIIIKPIFNINQKLVNYIAYEQEIAA